MATVLFTYELGAGLGHLTPLLSVAEALGSSRNIIFALPRPESVRTLIARAMPQAQVIHTVLWQPVVKNAAAIPTQSFADALFLFGFSDSVVLRKNVAACTRILNEHKPDLIVCDFAPAMRIAAAAVGCPVVAVGYGYSIPPDGRLLPPLRPWHKDVPPESRANEFAILAALNNAQNPGQPAIDHIASLFHGTDTFVCTLPAFDPYRAYRLGPTYSPIHCQAFDAGGPVSEREGPDLFIYLPKGHPQVPDIVRALQVLRARAELFVPGFHPIPEAYPRLQFLTAPASYEHILPYVKGIIHHGGLGSSLAGLLAGTPQLCFPISAEHTVHSRAVATLGAGRWHPGRKLLDQQKLTEVLSSMLSDSTLQTGALLASRAVDIIRSDPALQKIAMCCESYLT